MATRAPVDEVDFSADERSILVRYDNVLPRLREYQKRRVDPSLLFEDLQDNYDI